MNARFWLAVVAGIAVGVFSWLGMGGAGSFGPWSPFPSVIVVPSLAGSILVGGNQIGYRLLRYVLPVVIGPILFFAWNPQLLRGIETVPRKSWVGLLVLTGLTVFDFIASWSLGIRYQGWSYTVTVAAANGVALGVCWTLFVLARRQPSFFRNLLFHWTTTVWLVWLAFPWLGEWI